MDDKQGVCLFYQRTGTCRDGDNCPLSHVQEERGITTKYDDRIWQNAQVRADFAAADRQLFAIKLSCAHPIDSMRLTACASC